MPRKHVNIKVTQADFQVSLLDPFFHQQYTQFWETNERMPQLIKGHSWKECNQPLDFSRALDQCVLACSSLSKHLQEFHNTTTQAILIHISRDDVTFMLELKVPYQKMECLFRFTWDQNAQLIVPENFSQLIDFGFSEPQMLQLKEMFVNASYGRLGLIARCLRLMAQSPYFGENTSTAQPQSA